MANLRALRGSGSRRAMLIIVVVAAAAGLAACGTVRAGGGHAGTHASSASAAPSGSATPGSPLQGTVPLGAGPALCAQASHLTSLTITRVVTLPGHLHFPFPAKVTLTSPVQVHTVAAATCQLPQLPRVMMTCPADLGVLYKLAFAAPGHSYPPVTASAGGCQKVVGLDSTRKAGPAFWAALGRAIGLGGAASAQFGGTAG